MIPDTRINIRQAMPGDAAVIHTMIKGLAQALDLAGKNKGSVDDLVKHGFGKNAAFNALIAECGGEAVGMCTYFPVFSTWAGQPGVFVLDLFVAESQRGHGLGEKLLIELAANARKRGAVFVRLSVDNHNVRGQEFYHRLGFKHMEDESSFQINIDSLSQDQPAS